jgi:hypothetical protein
MAAITTGLGSFSVSAKLLNCRDSIINIIFVVEGIITTIFGIICFFTMPHTPAEAKFLTEDERAVALQRMMQDSHGATDVENVNEEHFNWHWVRMAMLSPQTWLSSFAWFFLLIPLYVSWTFSALFQNKDKE